MGARVLVAMSGGVDSSVAAGLLKEAGHECVGATLHLWDATGESQVGRCCAPEDRDDARRSCEHLGIPHYVFDEREAFRASVVEPFIDGYRDGATPAPCVSCNRGVKVRALIALADTLGCDFVATGHYARVSTGPEGPRLFRGADAAKDQSYFLFGVPDADLRRLMFPLGALEKDATRTLARRLGLPNADKPDSQELCFVPDGDVASFVQRERGDAAPGRVVDESGDVLGAHEEIAGFTVGKRRGLGLGGGMPKRYVLRVVPETRDVIVGPAERLAATTLRARDAVWRSTPGDAPFEAAVRIRHRHTPAPAEVVAHEGGFDVRFHAPQRAIAPGQAAVVYRGDEVLGGGFIDA